MITFQLALDQAQAQTSHATKQAKHNTEAMAQHETTTAALGLGEFGIQNDCKVFHNLTYEQLADHEKKFNEGTFVANGTFAVDTGKFTGRSPKDKF
ncbi:hypothetical protein PF005_g29895, partial [Phytophthora fragariae]